MFSTLLRVMIVLRTALLLVLLAACADSSSKPGGVEEAPGEPALADNRPGSTAYFSICEAGRTTAVSLTQQTELGFSASDVLEYAAGEHHEPLTWLSDPTIAVGPEDGVQDLTIVLEPRSDSARFHDPETGPIGHGAACRSWLEVDVRVTLRSTARALHETFDATLVSKDVRVAHLAAQTEEPRLQGLLEATQSGMRPSMMALVLAFSPFGVTGSLDAHWLDTTSARTTLAHWGASRCEGKAFALGPSQQLEGVSPQMLLDQISALERMTLTWLDGTRTTASVELEPDGNGACLSVRDYLDATGIDLQMNGTLTIESDDGRFSASMPASLSMGFGDESTDDLHVSVLTSSPAEVPAADLGFPDIDGTELEPLHRELHVSLDPSGEPSGTVSLRGVRRSNCVNTEPGGVFCEMVTEELETGTFSR
jgi:hypothetical protein